MKVLFIGGEADKKVIEVHDDVYQYCFPDLNGGQIQYEIYNLSGNTYVGILSGQSFNKVIKILVENYAKPELLDTYLTILNKKLYIEKDINNSTNEHAIDILETRLGF